MKYRIKTLFLLALLASNACSTNSSQARENTSARSDAQIARGDAKENIAGLESRYRQLEKEYSIAKKNKVDLSELSPLIDAIKQAKKQKDPARLSKLLDQFERGLADAYKSQNSSATLPAVTNLPKPTTNERPATSPSISEENLAIQKLSASKFYSLLHTKKGPPTMVAADGAVGRNKHKFSDVASQRDALWLLRNGMITNNSNYVSTAVHALTYAMKHQSKDGNFNNGLGYKAVTAAGTDAFYLFSYAYAYLLLKSDARFSAQFHELKAAANQIAAATQWLEKNKSELYRQDGKTPNRLLFDGMAFYFSSEATGITHHKTVGREFIYQALATQKPDGTFIEKGGYDTSYQAVSMLNLTMIYFHTNDETLRGDIKNSLDRAATWLVNRIGSNGEVSAQGNTRTGLGQEKHSGKSKEINYPEVALSLYYSSVILNRPTYIKVADKVVTYANAHLN